MAMAKDLEELLPKTVKIGYSHYSIEIQDDKWMDENKAYGDQHGYKKVINICDSWEIAEVVDTLFHEIDHAIWEYRGLKAKELEETAITSLNTERIRVFLDNPQLYKVLGEIYG